MYEELISNLVIIYDDIFILIFIIRHIHFVGHNIISSDYSSSSFFIYPLGDGPLFTSHFCRRPVFLVCTCSRIIK